MKALTISSVTHTNTHSIIGNVTTKYEEFLWGKAINQFGPGHFGTDLDISVRGTGEFRTWMRQYSLLTTVVWYLLIVNIFVLVHVVL
jgi:hypothetical protein